MIDWQQTVKFLQNLTEQVGDRLLTDFYQIHSSTNGIAEISTQKQDGSLVTSCDRWSDQHLKTALTAEFPEFGVLTEESDRTLPDVDWCWVVDPLDGTTNFARGIPIWAISIGLLYKGTPVFGYVYIPPLRQAFHGWFQNSETGIALPPNQAFLNNTPISCSRDRLTNNHFFSLCSRSLEAIDKVRFETKEIFPCKLRMLGVASYNLLTVATGATLGAVEATPKIWDIAAAWVIVQAAGALWIPLESTALFPLTPTKDFSDRNYPTLVIAQPDLLITFEPMVKPLLKS